MAASIVAGLMSPTRAADDEARNLARRVLKANGTAEVLDEIEARAISPILAKIKDPEQAAGARAELQKRVGQIRAEMIEDQVNHIAEKLSKDEMVEVIAFFEGSSGRKFKAVLLSQELRAITEGHFMKMMMLLARAGGQN